MKKIALILCVLILFSYAVSAESAFTDPSLSLTEKGLEIKLRTDSGREAEFFEGIYEKPLKTEYLIYESPDMQDSGREVSREELFETSGYPVIQSIYEANEEPYMFFTVKGETLNGEFITLEAYSEKTGEWKELNFAKDNGEGISLQAKIYQEDYKSKDGTLKLRVRPKLESNGSNSIYWITDTQYYTRMINKDQGLYRLMANYGRELYNQGKIGYVIHTGDVGNIPGFEEQLRVADDAQRIFDVAGIPNGILAGNHDVGHTNNSIDYSYFEKYFGKYRYASHFWYGEESKDDNSLNYQLVTLGNKDFIFINIGYGVENHPETLRWVGEILDKYKNRTAVISTHSYLGYEGEYINERMNEMFSEVLADRDNVRLILCGHMDSAKRNIRYVNGRLLVELLSDYQSLDPKRDGGEGYIRILGFEEDRLKSETYSPVTGSTSYYPDEEENFEIHFEYVDTIRSLDFSINALRKGESLGTSKADEFGLIRIYTDKTIHHFIVESAGVLEAFGETNWENLIPEKIETSVEGVNFHVGEEAGELFLKFNSKEKLDPRIIMKKDNREIPFFGRRWYHLDRFQYSIHIKDLDAGEYYDYDLNGLKGRIKIPGDNDASKVLVLADPQVGDENEGYINLMNTLGNYDLVSILGDLTDNGMDIDAFDVLLGKDTKGFYERTPLSVVKGNHDAPYYFQRIDTPKNEMESTYIFNQGNMEFAVLNTDFFDPVSLKRQERLLRKAKTEADENGRFLVVLMHKGIYSTGSHIDDSDVRTIRRFYAPLFDELGVDLVLSGHDHGYGRGFIDGGGEFSLDAPLYVNCGHAGSLKWYGRINYKVYNEPLRKNYEFLDFYSYGKDWEKKTGYVELLSDENTLEIKYFVLDNGEPLEVDSVIINK